MVLLEPYGVSWTSYYSANHTLISKAAEDSKMKKSRLLPSLYLKSRQHSMVGGWGAEVP